MITQISTDKLIAIGGPCVIESEDICFTVAEHMVRLCENLDVQYIFKASYDKANRTSADSFRGPGLDAGLKVLERVRSEFNVLVLTDVHEVDQVKPVAEVIDILQVPAFLSRQTDLLTACGATGKWVNIKKGQFMAPTEMVTAVAKVRAGGASDIIDRTGNIFWIRSTSE